MPEKNKPAARATKPKATKPAATKPAVTKPAAIQQQAAQPGQTNQAKLQAARVKTTATAAASKGTVSPNLTPQINITLNHDQIAQRAFAIWVAKGKPAGQDSQNWAEAENQLRQELLRRA